MSSGRYDRLRRIVALLFLSAAATPAGARISAAGPDSGVSVRELGPQFLKNSVGVTGADGATSLPLPGKRSLWVFGDTVVGPFESIHGLDLTPLPSNTAAIVPDQDLADGVQKYGFLATTDGIRPRQMIPFAAEEKPAKTRLWAIHGACIGSRVYLFYHNISLLEGIDVFENFRLEGMGLARAEVDSSDRFEFQRLRAPDGSREFWKPEQPTFGVWVERDNETVYVWGSLLTGMFLARAPAGEIENLSAYEYLIAAPTSAAPNVKPRWSREFTPTAVLFDSAPNEMSVSFNRHLGRYLAVHALGREGDIVMRLAPRRTGPWSEPMLIHRVVRTSERDFVYAAKEHPEYSSEGGRMIYITYVSSATYIPQLLEVTLPSRGPAGEAPRRLSPDGTTGR